MRQLGTIGIRLGVLLHAAVVFLAGTRLASGSGFLDAFGLLLLAAASVGFVAARVAPDRVDVAHTAFVGGLVGGLLVAVVFVTAVRADAATGAFRRFHHALATAGIPGWLVVDYGGIVVLAAGLVLGASYAFATLAGGALAAGDLVHVEGVERPGDEP